jgi:hypothetical protein
MSYLRELPNACMQDFLFYAEAVFEKSGRGDCMKPSTYLWQYQSPLSYTLLKLCL